VLTSPGDRVPLRIRSSCHAAVVDLARRHEARLPSGRRSRAPRFASMRITGRSAGDPRPRVRRAAASIRRAHGLGCSLAIRLRAGGSRRRAPLVIGGGLPGRPARPVRGAGVTTSRVDARRVSAGAASLGGVARRRNPCGFARFPRPWSNKMANVLGDIPPGFDQLDQRGIKLLLARPPAFCSSAAVSREKADIKPRNAAGGDSQPSASAKRPSGPPSVRTSIGSADAMKKRRTRRLVTQVVPARRLSC